jgi:hypothetical protein
MTHVEMSRKHGPFDTRWPTHYPAPSEAQDQGALIIAEAGEATEWAAFSAHYFPGTRRHDMRALAAYDSHRRRETWHLRDRSPTPASSALPETMAENLAAMIAGAAIDEWESDGGSILPAPPWLVAVPTQPKVGI